MGLAVSDQLACALKADTPDLSVPLHGKQRWPEAVATLLAGEVAADEPEGRVHDANHGKPAQHKWPWKTEFCRVTHGRNRQ